MFISVSSENKIESGGSAQQSWMLREGVSPQSPPVFIACGETQFNENSSTKSAFSDNKKTHQKIIKSVDESRPVKDSAYSW
jgi:hypothetical protein